MARVGPNPMISPVSREQFQSCAQNAEDVVLWRALGGATRGGGRYIEIGANDPLVDSISWAFYERGWRGITAEPVPALAAAHREQRPEDIQVEAVIGALDVEEVILHEIEGSGLSTIESGIAGQHAASGWSVRPRTVPVRRLDDVLDAAGWDDGRDIHFLTVDTEGSEAAVLASLDLKRYRPWVLVIEATAPTSTEQTHELWEPVRPRRGLRPVPVRRALEVLCRVRAPRAPRGSAQLPRLPAGCLHHAADAPDDRGPRPRKRGAGRGTAGGRGPPGSGGRGDRGGRAVAHDGVDALEPGDGRRCRQ